MRVGNANLERRQMIQHQQSLSAIHVDADAFFSALVARGILRDTVDHLAGF